MKIISWNVNSVRARINNILDYIKHSKPDILMLQEIKTENKNFPTTDFEIRVIPHIYLDKKVIMVLLFYQKSKLIISVQIL